MFFDAESLTEVATVVKTHGLRGKLSLNLFDAFSNDIIKENMPVFLLIRGMPVPFFVVDAKKTGRYIRVGLDNVDTEEIANKYVKLKVFILSKDVQLEEIAETDNYVGYSVFDKEHGYIGIFSFVNMIPANPVFEIDFNGKTIILPFSDNVIKNIDENKKEIYIDAPHGLIDIYL